LGRHPLVLGLVHGWGASGLSWAAVAGLLAQRYLLHAPDLPGHGSRMAEPRPEPLTVEALADDVAGRLPPGPAYLVGHSMGGQVVVRAALRHPGRVAGLVVVDPAYGAGPAEVAGAPARLADLRARGATAGVEWVPGAFPSCRPVGLLRATRARMARTPGPVLADLYESMYLASHSIGAVSATGPVLDRLEVPVLSVYSTTGAARVAETFNWRDGSRVEVWPGTCHFLHEQRPHAFARLVEDWLGSLGGGH
jgi:pimeloyl-ACP methyl ester carboxylesterase